jgi:biotin carboxyl carrier protein
MKKFIVRVNGKSYEVEVEEVTAGVPAASAPGPVPTSVPTYAPSTPAPSKPAPDSDLPSGEMGSVKAPMPGIILSINVSPGDMVSSGEVLMNLEAMKMENEIFAPIDGKVVSIHVSVGDSVNAGDTLIDLE